jgi:hypothetical protein
LGTLMKVPVARRDTILDSRFTQQKNKGNPLILETSWITVPARH